MCTNDGLDDDYVFVASGASNTDYIFLLTDENNTITTFIQAGESYNFEELRKVRREFGVAYTGTFTAQVGDDAAAVALSDGCYELSTGYVSVFTGQLMAGTVSTTIGVNERFTCPGDGNADVITFTHEGTGSGTFVYILTDANNLIVAAPTTAMTDFESLPEGVYRAWGLVYTGELIATPGDDAATAPLATGCYDLSDNYVTVNNVAPAAGEIFTAEGGDVVSVCAGDGISDVFEVSVIGASDAAYTFLVVEEDSTLVGIISTNQFDFDMAAPGDWRIYGLSYTGSLGILPGAHIFEDQIASGCYELTPNYVFVDKTRVDGGEIFTDAGRRVVYTCPDGVPDIVNFVNSGSSDEDTYRYVLTTQTNVVLSILTGNVIDFETAGGLSALRIWGVSFTGNANLSIGNIITQTVISDGCYALSDNYIDVFIDQPEGGQLSFDDGSDALRFCHSNFMPAVHVNTSSTATIGYAYIVTDTFNVVQQVSEPVDGFVNFDNLLPDTYRIWAVSYAGILTVEPGDNVTEVNLSSSCFELSDNYLTILRTTSLDAGNVGTLNGDGPFYFCGQNGIDNILILTHDSSDPLFRYVITNGDNDILFGDIESDVLDFDPLPDGTYRIYGVTYTGNFTPFFMSNVLTDPLSTDCWALSNNFVEIFVQTPEGGTVATNDGLTEITVIVGDGVDDIAQFVASDATAVPYVYVMTDENNVVTGVAADGMMNFEGMAPGTSRIWGLAYTGNLTVLPGTVLDGTLLSDDCFDLSDNFVTVNRVQSSNISPDEEQQATVVYDVVSMQVYPNPVGELLHLTMYLPTHVAASQQLAIFNMSGNMVWQATTQEKATANAILITSTLYAGAVSTSLDRRPGRSESSSLYEIVVSSDKRLER
ncbi:MAG: hypothetical protein R2795_25315 [Saprospiraceae bacterium]